MASNRWWSPPADAMTATRLMDRMLDQFFGYGTRTPAQPEGSTTTFAIPVDVLETDDSFILYATIAGIPSENVEVTFEDGVLAISAKAAPFGRQGRWLRQERPWGNWIRKLELPKEVEPDKISADVADGVLTVTVPKAATAQPVRIPVGGAS